MPPLLVQLPDMGLDALTPDNVLDPRGAASGSENIIYERGFLRTPYGFAKLDLTTGLNSGDTVLHVFPFKELDGYMHLIAVTTDKIYDHDRVNEKWTPKTQSGVTMSSDIYNPISFVEIGHDDTNIYLDDDTNKENIYHHLIICDGGLSNIQRWAGRYETDFGDLVGAGGYHNGTTHRAQHVGLSWNRLVLLSPQDYDSGSSLWVKNNQRVRWPTIGKIQTWTGTGSGSVELLDTGGTNVWAANLGSQYIIYQTKGIWSLNYVGGTTVFSPMPMIPDLGLLAPHLLVPLNNVHYYIGTDYNVYAYYGGTVNRRIGDKIHSFLQEDLDATYSYRCWMAPDKEHKRLWIFIVPSGSTYITKAYGMDIRSGAWMVRDFAHKWSSSTTGITAVNLIGAESYTVGETYQEALDTLSAYGAADDTATTAGDTTERYGDALFDGTHNVLDWSTVDTTLDFTQVALSAGGLFFCFTTPAGDATNLVGDDTDYSGLVMRIDDGSDSNDMPTGSHYYTLTDISIVDDVAGISCKVNLAPCESTGTAVADLSTDTPAIHADTTATIYDPSGVTYREDLEEVYAADRMVLGDSDGLVYQFDTDLTTGDDNTLIASRHLTPVFDLGEPDLYKRWPGIAIVGKGSAVQVGYRTDDFDTSDTGWTDYTCDLTDTPQESTFYINKTSRQIQFIFKDFSGWDFQIEKYKVLEPLIEENR